MPPDIQNFIEEGKRKLANENGDDRAWNIRQKQIEKDFEKFALSIYKKTLELAEKEILGKKAEFWEDTDHAVGGYVSKKEIKDSLSSLKPKQ